MKTTVLKMLVLPIAAFMLASAGAVSTNTAKESKTKSGFFIAYAHDPNANSCKDTSVTGCNTITGPVCTVSSWSMFLKNSDGECIVPLYRH